jgi:uncharacterized protein (DUF362 family)
MTKEKKVTRRSFIKKSTVIGASSLLGGSALLDLVSATSNPVFATETVDLCAVEGKSYFDNTIKAVDALGGMKKFVPKDAKVGLLASVVWEHPSTNVRPEVMAATARMCLEAGAKEIRSLKDFADGYWQRWKLAGTDHKGEVKAIKAGGGEYKVVDIPKGKHLKQATVFEALLECDVLINLTIAKQHTGCRFTGALKNMMGACAHDPTNRFVHFGNRENVDNWYEDVEFLSECIADLNYLRKPDLCITDATEFITTNGPFGPGKIGQAHNVVACTDPVAIDAYCVRFQELKVEDVSMIKHAHNNGFGEIDLSKLKVSKIKA